MRLHGRSDQLERVGRPWHIGLRSVRIRSQISRFARPDCDTLESQAEGRPGMEFIMTTMIQVDYDQLEQERHDREREQRRALRDITGHAGSLRRYLQSVAVDVDRALTRMDQGQMPGGAFFGPIGHQAPFDVAIATTRLEAAIERANALGVAQDQILEAYNKGAKEQS